MIYVDTFCLFYVVWPKFAHLFVYSISDFSKVTIIFIYIRHVRIKFDKDCALKVIMGCVFSNIM